jgi:2-deoxy-D-gluconate 3-dehydrogenase
VRKREVSALFDLHGKCAVVTGASKGLGRAIALALAGAGADVVGVDRTPEDETAEEVRRLGRRFHVIQADLSDAACIPDIVAEAGRTHGAVDILVNNAGTIRRRPAEDFTEADWDDVMNVNLRSVFFLCQAAGRAMLRTGNGGKIINIASMLSYQGGFTVASYTASKHGVAGITKLLANEWAAKGINVNAIAPGYFATDNTQALRDDPKRSAAILDRIPAGRWGEPADLAGAAVFLASPAADYLHGSIVAVDGGWLAR